MPSLTTAVSALEQRIPNPSPAMQAYIEMSRMHAINADDIEIPVDAWKRSLDRREQAWSALTPDERNTINTILNSII